jgi:hypothetical protein
MLRRMASLALGLLAALTQLAPGPAGLPILALAPVAEAFETDPEFRSLSESESFLIDQPARLDSESTSDLMTYWLPADWISRTLWFAGETQESRSFYQNSTGSLSGNFFYINERARIEAPLPRFGLFRAHLLKDRDMERDETRVLPEIFWQLGSWLWLSSYAEMSKSKRENDLGVALTGQWASPPERTLTEVRLSITWVDFVRGERSDRPERFRPGREPQVWTALARHRREWAALETGLRLERATELENPESLQLFWFERRLAWLIATGQIQGDTGWSWSLRAQWDRQRRQLDNLATAQTSGGWRERLQILASLGRAAEFWQEPFAFEFWAGSFDREWRMSDTPVPLSTAEAERRVYGQSAVHLAAQLRWLGREIWRPEAGLEGALFRDRGDARLGPSDRREQATELRLNLRSNWVWSADTELGFALTFDIDRFGQAAMFEGGQGRFHLSF